MKRSACAVVLAGVVVTVLAVRALAKEDLSGNWMVNLYEQGKQHTFWLLRLTEKGDKLEGNAEPAKKVPPSTLSGLRTQDGLLEFAVDVRGTVFNFQGKVPKGDAKKIRGSMARLHRRILSSHTGMVPMTSFGF